MGTVDFDEPNFGNRFSPESSVEHKRTPPLRMLEPFDGLEDINELSYINSPDI
jgi:hypothetical protein